jgi:class 3 adenylate cyclase
MKSFDILNEPVRGLIPPNWFMGLTGIEGLRALSSGSWHTPTLTLFGMQLQAISDGRLTAVVPASPWFCGDSRHVSPGMIANFINMGCWFSGFTLHRAGNSFAGLDDHVRFFHQPVADGRPMRLEANSVRGDGDQFIHEAALYDADNNLVARGNVMAVMIDNKRRKRQQRRVAERALCTILFTDIVDSTRAAGALGDKAWNALLEQHNDTARREIARCTGTVVKSTGDGLLARFATPAQGLDCAVRLRDALKGLGISIRAGLHMGECEIMDDDIIGMAVNLAARIQAAAQPGQVYVSSTVRDLVGGSNYQFESRGEHQLKGFEEPWRLWSVK